MAMPKTKPSKSVQRKARAVQYQQSKILATTQCTTCGAPKRPHRICRACGTYKNGKGQTLQVTEARD